MPVGLETRCQQILVQVVAISQAICISALGHTNRQNLNISDKLRCQLETIRTSASTILGAFTRASLTDYTIDDRINDWLLSGEPPLCLDKLREIESLMKPTGPIGPARVPTGPPRAAEDKLTAAMVFFNKHTDLFHFLLTPNIWNHERLVHEPSEVHQVDTIPTTEETQDDPPESQMSRSGATATQNELGGNIFVSNSEQVVTTRRQKLDEVSRWLAALDCTEKHNSTLKLRQEATCMWFPKTDAYREWRTAGTRNHFLWLHGKAGCGKSVLAASTIEQLKNKLRQEEVVVFFYCDFQNERSTSSTELMRSVLSQLCHYFSDRSVDPGDLPNKILEEKSKGTLLLNDLNKLSEFVSRAASRFLWEPIIVIDALDECVDIDTLLPALVKLNQDDVRLLVTSRPHEDVLRHFEGLQSLSFENVSKELATDIALHITREIDSYNRLRIADPDIKDEISVKLNEKAEGRFRWVDCQLDTLKRCGSRVEMKKALDNLPNELEATYERILGAIDERKSEGKLARRALVWLVVALEPLRLVQIVDASLVDPEQRQGNREMKWLRAVLLNALSSLVSYDEETDVLTLSHFSVKEYLMSSVAPPTYHVVSHVAHADVAQMCFRYISALLKQKPIRDNIASLESFSMLSYVFSTGFNHIAHVDPQSIVILKALESLGSDVRHHPSHWDCLRELREDDLRWSYPPWPSSRHDFVFYILIAYSAPELLRSFLSTRHPLKPRIGTNPLIYAADLRKTEHAMDLLACGVDVNMHSLMAVDDSHKALPLDVAIDRSNDVLVGELLQRGCRVTSQVLSTAVCMPWCSTRVLIKLMATDEFAEWANEIGGEKLYRGVFNSARPNVGDSRQVDEDHVALVRRLREIGQELSVANPFGVELIERAVHAAHLSMLDYLLPPDRPPPSRFLLAASTGDTSETVSVVRFLLGRGVDTNAVSDGSGDTALHLAALCPWEPRSLELTQMLINAGCNPHTCNTLGQAPFTIAVERGYLSVVEHLLSYNVSFRPDTLPVTLQQGSTPEMVKFLIHKGACVHSTTSDGDSVLHLAIANYVESSCLDLVKSFIEAGCVPTTYNSRGKTVMEAAIEHGYTSVVEHLLSCNVPFSLDILPSSLQNRSTPQMVEFLIHKGADVHCIMSNGNTVLHLAISNYVEPTCLELIKCLVDVGCDPAICNSQGKTVLEAAIGREYTSVVKHLLLGNIPLPPDIISNMLRNQSTPQMVEFLIHQGADVHSITSNGDTVLHLAIANYVESTCWVLVKSFTEAGCNLTTRNSEGKSVFEVAFEYDYTSVMDHLLSCNAPLALPPNILPIMLHTRSSPRIVELLVHKGADVHSTTPSGDTVLHLAVANYVESSSLALVKSFMKAGCDPATRNFEGKTAFEVAFECDYKLVMEHLLSCDAPLALPPNILPIMLHTRSSLRMVELLLHKGADVHSTTFNGDTTLHLAIANYVEPSSLALVMSFMKAGCDLTTRNSEGKTVFEVALECDYKLVMERLLSCDAPLALPPNILPIAMHTRSSLEIVKLLIRKGADIHSTTSSGDTVLHLAITNYVEPSRLVLVRNFIKAGCDPATCNSEGKTVFEVAIECDNISVMEILVIETLRSCNAPPVDTSNAFPIALHMRLSPRIVEFLVHKDVYFTGLTGLYGDTVLRLAIANYVESLCLDLVKCLVNAGYAPVGYFPAETPLEAAMKRGYTSVTEYLLSLDVALLPAFDMLSKALQERYVPRIIQLLVSHRTSNLAVMPKSHWNTLFRLAHASYSGEDRRCVVQFLKVGHETMRRESIQPFMSRIRRYLENRD